MAALTGADLYERYVKQLPLSERLRLLELTAGGLVDVAVEQSGSARRSLLELEGLGAEVWEGVDAQKYVDSLRAEWDERP